MSEVLLLDVREVGRRTGFCESIVRRWIREGRLPSLKVGGGRRILVSELEAFIERLRRERDEEAAVL